MKIVAKYFQLLCYIYITSWAGIFLYSEEAKHSFGIEVLLDKNIATKNDLNQSLISAFDISPDKLILIGTDKRLYYLGWGGLLPIQNSLSNVHSFAYTRDGSLLLIKENFLYSIDERGKNYIPLLELPVPNMRIANSSGADQVYLYECQAVEKKGSYGLFILFPDMSYKKILESPEPIECVADMQGLIFFATGSAIYEIDLSRQMRMVVAAPPKYKIRAIATDNKKNIIYFSDLHSIYAHEIKNETVSEVLKTAGGYLKYFEDSLFVFNPEQKLLIRLVER